MLSFPKRNTSPRGDADIQNVQKTLLIFVQLTKDDLLLLTKKKKKFYAFYIKCRMKTKESANQSKGCDAKLQGL